MTTEMKAIEQYFPVVLSIMLYKVVLTFESVNEAFHTCHWNKSFYAAHFFHAVSFVFFYNIKNKFGIFFHSNL